MHYEINTKAKTVTEYWTEEYYNNSGKVIKRWMYSTNGYTLFNGLLSDVLKDIRENKVSYKVVNH